MNADLKQEGLSLIATVLFCLTIGTVKEVYQQCQSNLLGTSRRGFELIQKFIDGLFIDGLTAEWQ